MVDLGRAIEKYKKRKYVESEGEDRFDCWVFMKLLWLELGYSFEREYELNKRIFKDEFNCGKDWKSVPFPKRLDLVIFVTKRGYVYHCGTMLNHYKFVHCCSDLNVAISELNERWKKRVLSFHRLKNGLCLS